MHRIIRSVLFTLLFVILSTLLMSLLPVSPDEVGSTLHLIIIGSMILVASIVSTWLAPRSLTGGRAFFFHLLNIIFVGVVYLLWRSLNWDSGTFVNKNPTVILLTMVVVIHLFLSIFFTFSQKQKRPMLPSNKEDSDDEVLEKEPSPKDTKKRNFEDLFNKDKKS